MLHQIRSSKAFSLLEVVVVLIIIGILAALAAPQLADVLDNTRQEAAVIEANSGVRAASAVKATLDDGDGDLVDGDGFLGEGDAEAEGLLEDQFGEGNANIAESSDAGPDNVDEDDLLITIGSNEVVFSLSDNGGVIDFNSSGEIVD